MAVAAFLWGALSDRFGPRIVVLCGSVLLGLGLVLASGATSLVEFQLVFGLFIGAAAGAFYAPMMALASGWFDNNRSLAVALVSAGAGMAPLTVAPFARWLIDAYEWRPAMLIVGITATVLLVPAALLTRRPPVVLRCRGGTATRRPYAGRRAGLRTTPVGGRGAAHASVRGACAGPLRLLCRPFRSDLPHGDLRDRLRHPGDGRGQRL